MSWLVVVRLLVVVLLVATAANLLAACGARTEIPDLEVLVRSGSSSRPLPPQLPASPPVTVPQGS